jgi:hypothetical protein
MRFNEPAHLLRSNRCQLRTRLIVGLRKWFEIWVRTTGPTFVENATSHLANDPTAVPIYHPVFEDVGTNSSAKSDTYDVPIPANYQSRECPVWIRNFGVLDAECPREELRSHKLGDLLTIICRQIRVWIIRCDWSRCRCTSGEENCRNNPKEPTVLQDNPPLPESCSRMVVQLRRHGNLRAKDAQRRAVRNNKG